MEKEKRRNDAIIQVIPIKTHDQNVLKQVKDDLMKNTMEIKIDIKGARKLEEKICLRELQNITDKEKIIKNKYRLKKMRGARIYINNDMDKI